ncbi:hypothetical protein GCM10025868_33490 [Angustibacter aerolatus]|uniref:Uncharacterized protein n=1 Tax=Angustibacter aerolatus TaxID=1162965 RepID=A0ABQ6JLV0_9ACTN|nr:hypothetical protein [Angustibacter aerolatus]GMA88099.1 hypothetical protein GCM10025868_33490 [Angustibacter aerolatus]
MPAEALERREAGPLTADEVLDAVLRLRDPATDLVALACAARPGATRPAQRLEAFDRPEHPDVC